MKVLHLWRSDSVSAGGGGAVAMYRLHCGLREAGIESRILCVVKTTDSPYVSVVPTWRIPEAILGRITSRFGLNDIHRISSFRIKRHETYLEADIIHFHGTHSGFLSYLALPSLTRSKAAVFTLHDMWCLTGHCAHSKDCDRWRIGCGKCPYLDAYPPVRRDSTRFTWKLKNWVYSRSSLQIVSPSTWLAALARESMLSHFPIYCIPHGVDCDAYQPFDQEQYRSLLGIPPGKKVLMFAAGSLRNIEKGFDILLEALNSLPKSLKSNIVLVTFGGKSERIESLVNLKMINLGFLDNDRLKAIAYSVADLFILPTRAEAFGLVLLESMACGTPTVSFRVGGVPDLVRPCVTGYLAEPESAEDLSQGIVQLLEDKPLRDYLSQQCRQIALKEYTLELQVQRHIKLYRQAIETK